MAFFFWPRRQRWALPLALATALANNFEGMCLEVAASGKSKHDGLAEEAEKSAHKLLSQTGVAQPELGKNPDALRKWNFVCLSFHSAQLLQAFSVQPADQTATRTFFFSS